MGRSPREWDSGTPTDVVCVGQHALICIARYLEQTIQLILFQSIYLALVRKRLKSVRYGISKICSKPSNGRL